MNKPSRLKERLLANHRLIVWASQIGMFAFSAVVAFLLRFDLSLPLADRHYLVYALPIWIVVKIVAFHAAKLDRGLWRYVSTADIIRVAMGNVTASAVSCLLISLIGPSGFPRSIYVLDLMVCFLATCGLRIIVRTTVEATASLRGRDDVGKSALIYGAGEAGFTLLREIRNNPRLSYRVVGFLDDRPDKRGFALVVFRCWEEETRLSPL